MSRLCVAAVVLVTSLCATSTVIGSSAPTAASSATTTLSLLAANAQSRGTNSLIEAFRNTHPGFEVKATYAAGSSQLAQLLDTQIGGGSPPDIAYLNQGNSILGMNGYAQAGHLADLSKEAWVKKLPKVLRQAGQYHGRQYALPFSSYMIGSIYDKTAFRKAGIEVPKTMTALIADCKTIRTKTPGVTPVGLALAEPGAAGAAFLGVFTQYVDRSFNSLKTSKRTSFASNKSFKETFTVLNRMKAAGCFSPGAPGTTAAQAQRDVTTGASAMYFYVNTTLGLMRQAGQAAGQDVGFMGIPGKSAQSRRIPIASVLYGVSSKTSVASSKKFLAYMATTANNSSYNNISGGLSTRAISTGNLPAGNEPAASIVKQGGLLSPWYFDWPNANMFAYTGKELQAWFTGQSPGNGSRMLKGLDYMWANPSAVAPPG